VCILANHHIIVVRHRMDLMTILCANGALNTHQLVLQALYTALLMRLDQNGANAIRTLQESLSSKPLCMHSLRGRCAWCVIYLDKLITMHIKYAKVCGSGVVLHESEHGAV
jgi:hypothetical protein